MRFLGPTTVFQGSVVRPHDLDVYAIAVRDAVKSEVTDVQRVGHEVRLIAKADWRIRRRSDQPGTAVALTRAHFRDLALDVGDTVWLRLAPGASQMAAATVTTPSAG